MFKCQVTIALLVDGAYGILRETGFRSPRADNWCLRWIRRVIGPGPGAGRQEPKRNRCEILQNEAHLFCIKAASIMSLRNARCAGWCNFSERYRRSAVKSAARLNKKSNCAGTGGKTLPRMWYLVDDWPPLHCSKLTKQSVAGGTGA